MKNIIILDVDETLLNIEPLFFLKKFNNDYKKTKGKVIRIGKKEYYIAKRPNIDKLIEKLKKNHALVAFSTVDREITIKKLKILGLDKHFTKVYGRESLVDKKKSIKTIADDLKIPSNKIIAVDDMPELYLENENIIKIEPWFIGKEDRLHARDLIKLLN